MNQLPARNARLLQARSKYNRLFNVYENEGLRKSQDFLPPKLPSTINKNAII
jgi:hypothetical protein